MFTLPHSMTLLTAGKICCIQGEKAKALMPVHRVFKGETQILDSKNPHKHCHGKAKGLIYWLDSSTCYVQLYTV